MAGLGYSMGKPFQVRTAGYSSAAPVQLEIENYRSVLNRPVRPK